MTVVFLNALTTYLSNRKRQQAVQDKMHSMFVLKSIEDPPKLAVMLVGLLDMGFAFCSFWPANILPVFIIVCQMQLFIPLDTLAGRFMCGRLEHKRHLVFSAIILIGIALSAASMF